MDPSRLIVTGLWAIGMLVVWGAVLRDDWQRYRRDRRNVLAEFLSDSSLFLSAVAAAVALLAILFGQEVAGLRGFAVAVFLGAFLGAGIVKLTLRRVRS